MAKELPYFKFEPNQWENGNIQMLSREDKGLFIDLCSMYWSRLGDVPLKLATQKLCAGNATAFKSLCDEKIIEILEGNIFIKFLSEQLNEFEYTSKQNSKNAKEGWEKRRKQKEESERNATASKPQSESDAIREDESIEEKKRKEKKRENKKKEGDSEPILILPFQSLEFNELWLVWKKYKSDEHKFKYKSIVSEQAALLKLNELSKNNEETALEIIRQSISEGWKGFFELKKQINNGKQNTNSNGKYSEDFMRKIASGLQS